MWQSSFWVRKLDHHESSGCPNNIEPFKMSQYVLENANKLAIFLNISKNVSFIIMVELKTLVDCETVSFQKRWWFPNLQSQLISTTKKRRKTETISLNHNPRNISKPIQSKYLTRVCGVVSIFYKVLCVYLEVTVNICGEF